MRKCASIVSITCACIAQMDGSRHRELLLFSGQNVAGNAGRAIARTHADSGCLHQSKTTIASRSSPTASAPPPTAMTRHLRLRRANQARAYPRCRSCRAAAPARRAAPDRRRASVPQYDRVIGRDRVPGIVQHHQIVFHPRYSPRSRGALAPCPPKSEAEMMSLWKRVSIRRRIRRTS